MHDLRPPTSDLRLVLPITPVVDNRGEKWGQVARAVDKWHNVRVPEPRIPDPVLARSIDWASQSAAI